MKVPYLLPLLTCILGLFLTATVYSIHKGFENKEDLQIIMSDNKSLLSNVKIDIGKNILLINTLQAFYNASTEVSREDFRVFSQALLDISPSIQAVEWVPRVTHKDRYSFQQKAIKDGFHDFDIIEPAPGGGFMPSEKRDVYYPVYYVEPLEGNEVVLGLDPPNHKSRIEAISTATKTGEVAATSPVMLTQENKYGERYKGILLFSPVYYWDGVPDSVDKREAALNGLVLMVLRVSDVVKYTLATSNIDHGVTIIDVSDETTDDLIYQSAKINVNEGLIVEDVMDVGGRKWKICVYPKIVNGGGVLGATSWAIIFAGLGLTAFFTFAISQLIYQRKIVEGLVKDRTKEVRELSSAMEKTVEGVSVINKKGSFTYVNEAYAALCGYSTQELVGENWNVTIAEEDHPLLIDACKQAMDDVKAEFEACINAKNGEDINVRISMVKKMDEKRGFVGYYCFMSDVTQRKQAEIKLKQANEELEEFAYRTSHDLRSPLVSSIGLLNIVKFSIETNDYDIALESVGHIEGSLKSLDALVDEILALTKMKYSDEEDVRVDIYELVDDSLKKLDHLPNFDRLTIDVNCTPSCSLQVKKSRLKLIVENLISNAIKYQDTSREDSYIKISCYSNYEGFVFEVRDNGLGIPEEFRDRLFRMFQRFHPKESYGSGLGLYMMKKSADIISADLIVEHLTQGTVFKLIIPVNQGEGL